MSVKLKPLYSVWRHHRLVFIGTFQECKMWLYHHDKVRGDEYLFARRCLSESYRQDALDWILCRTEYACIKDTEPCDYVGLGSFDPIRPINQLQS